MSGPIEYVVVISAARLAIIQASRMAEMAERAARTVARLAAQRAKAAQRAAKTRARFAEQRDRAEQRSQRERDQLAKGRSVTTESTRKGAGVTHTHLVDTQRQTAESTERLGAKVAPDTQAADRCQATTSHEMVADSTQVSGTASQQIDLEQLFAWQEVLADEQAVAHFQFDAASDWNNKVTTLLAEIENGHPAVRLAEQVRELVAAAEKIHDQAGDDQAKFATRNELLQDIIASLQEIGYFVKDPILSNPADPRSPVLVTAIRGDEEMVATVDLSETIRSVWNGSETDHCKYAFFDYVDRMKTRGIDVSTKREDLQERPKLKEKGAKELPRDTTRHR